MNSEKYFEEGLKLLEENKLKEARESFLHKVEGEDPFNVLCNYFIGLIEILENNNYEALKRNLLKYINLYVVKLRRLKNSQDPRLDPYYNEGHFGSTGCHSDNLLLKEKIQERFLGNKFSLLMFIQGGKNKGDKYTMQKIPYISHCTKILKYNIFKHRCTLYWDALWGNKKLRPLKYEFAFEITKEISEKINPNFEKESGDMSKFYSYVRSLSVSIDNENAVDIIIEYYKWRQKMYKKHGDDAFVDYDWETLASSDCKKVQIARGIND